MQDQKKTSALAWQPPPYSPGETKDVVDELCPTKAELMVGREEITVKPDEVVGGRELPLREED